MSRTYKDIKKVKLKKYYRERWETEYTEYKYEAHKYLWPDFDTPIGLTIRTAYLKKPGILTKKRKEEDDIDHWMTTPSWWNNLFHTRPIRGNFRTFLTNVVKSDIAEIEDMLEPTDSKSPHKYFW